MKSGFHISLMGWNKFLRDQEEEYNIYVPVKKDVAIDYDLINNCSLPSIIYNTPKPVTPLKLFFLPVKENVTLESTGSVRKNVIVGTPACDLAALGILDEMYLTPPFIDSYYKMRRDNTILIGTDCYDLLEHCHCTTYGIKPYPTQNHDISLSVIDERAYIHINTDKGEAFLEGVNKVDEPVGLNEEDVELIHSKRQHTRDRLDKKNVQLPGYKETGELIKDSDDAIWEKYAKACVSCGACTAICPTCTCFLMIDRPGFEKIRQLDACQYPGFARIAAGEDHLKDLTDRFKNRYLCKYVWKAEKFDSIACTGCGRCIETCIGGIDKNELFMELASIVEAE